MRARGLTLIEISIALAIAALLVAISVPAISSITRAQLRQKSGQLSGGIRALYGQSAIAGKSCRLALDLDKSEYQAECARGSVRLSGEPETSGSGGRESSRDEELLARAKGDRSTLSDEDRVRLELLRKGAFAPSAEVPRTALGGSVRFRKVWVSHQQAGLTAGTAYLYFWPSGQTEAASIELAQGDDVTTLLVSPLTGRVRLVNGPAAAPGEAP
jgi:general secretion pathway protein H